MKEMKGIHIALEIKCFKVESTKGTFNWSNIEIGFE